MSAYHGRMEPRIQYATTSDGVSIAFFEVGDGPPCIHVPPIPFSHLTAVWADPSYREWYERLAERTRTIVFDNRGSGLSDRDVSDLSLEGYMRDIDAVAGRLGLDRFGLVGECASGPVAAAYAGLHPERVTGLTLWCTSARGVDLGQSSPALALLRRQDWHTFTETISHAMVAGWDDPQAARGFAAIMRAATSAGELDRLDALCASFDATPYLDRIVAPTLILHRKDAPLWPVEEGRKLAARIAGARMVLLDGGALLPYLGMERSLEAFFELMGVPGPVVPRPPAHETASHDHPGSLRIILFTDIEGHTAIMQRLGDERGREVLREHERITRAALRDHGGHEVKTMGDGFMASFSSAQKALECAIALQRSIEQANRESQIVNREFLLRVGINAGEPIAEDGDLFGNAVIAASRIAGLSQGGEILVANVVRELTAGKGFLFSDRGDHALRGFEDPVRVWQLRWD